MDSSQELKESTHSFPRAHRSVGHIEFSIRLPDELNLLRGKGVHRPSDMQGRNLSLEEIAMERVRESAEKLRALGIRVSLHDSRNEQKVVSLYAE